MVKVDSMCVVLLITSIITPGFSYTMLERFRRIPSEDNFEDIDGENEYVEENNNVKRQNPGGTCTCTCETKPVENSGSKKTFPETASLLRTGSSKPEIAGASRLAGKPSVKVNEGVKIQPHDDLRSKIVKVEPMDYSEIMNMEPVPEKQTEEEAKTEEVFSKTEPESSQDSWGHESRFPWKNLPDTMCFREPCKSDRNCCTRFNLCDKSAKVCVDCWYGSTCATEADCCQRYPYCQKPKHGSGNKGTAVGKCVNNL